jgi:hypothetical protein
LPLSRGWYREVRSFSRAFCVLKKDLGGRRPRRAPGRPRAAEDEPR